ncbi:MAG: methyltransferase domain-containing protein [Oscillatoriales cyanobacterium C42_A2020_001]|nr:methyltransferase domain-containing protein [Leptolyngbyaceae cyanobacterium C42_A2020_001]
MDDQKAGLLEKIRQQFDTAPYPRVPLERSPKGEVQNLYIHDLVTPYYVRNQQVVNPAGKVILDAGCGSGYKSLILAEANPGAKIVGIDLSEESVKLARERLKYHGFENTEFHALTIEELPSLGMEFDYINCDEVLYLLTDPVVGLQAMKSVLKPDGIIRANFHSRLQRAVFHQAQEFFTLMGLMDNSPNEAELTAVRDIMRSLKDGVLIKSRTWNPAYDTDDQRLLANHLLRGDKGVNIPEFFAILQAANLEFISMVNWWQWNLIELFKDFTELPVEVAFTLADKTPEEQLHLFELLHPYHRLLDVWCGHPGQGKPYAPVDDWSESQWQEGTVYINSQLKTDAFKQELVSCISEFKLFEISQYLQKTDTPINVDNLIASCLLLLLEQPRPVQAIVHHWKTLRPLNPVTLQPTTEEEAFETVKQRLIELEHQGYVMLEAA